MDTELLKKKIQDSGLKAADIMSYCPLIERSQANSWLSESKEVAYSKPTYYLLSYLCDFKMGGVKYPDFEVKKSKPKTEDKEAGESFGIKVDLSAGEQEILRELHKATTNRFKTSMAPEEIIYMEPTNEEDIDLDYENQYTMEYECLSTHLDVALAPEGKMILQGSSVVFTHNKKGYKASPSEDSPIVVFFDGGNKFKMEQGPKNSIKVSRA